MVIAYLDIICWSYSIGGEHYTGEIKFSNKFSDITVEEVRHALTKKEALHLNKKDGIHEYFQHTPGDLSRRFNSREQLIRSAARLFLSKYQGILINSFFGCASARPVICASKGLEKEFRVLNKLANQWEKLGGYDKGNDRKTKQIDTTWRNLIRKIENSNT